MESGPRNTSFPLLLLLLFFFVGGWAQEEAICPLAANNKEYFHDTPQPVEGCCKDEWVKNSPFVDLANKLIGNKSACQSKLNKMAQLLCSPHQATVTSSHQVLGVAYVCDSFCNDLLETCGELALEAPSTLTLAEYYKGDGEYFCKDLFRVPIQNLTTSVVPLSSRQCLDDSVRQCDSTKGDFTGFYTECDVASVTREYHFQYKDGDQCTGGEKLPAPKVGLPCWQSCEPGSILPEGELECQECQAGSFSVGGGYLFEEWKDWPPVFEWETYCETNDGVNFDQSGDRIDNEDCKGWLVNDTYVVSSSALEDMQSSVLNVKASLVREGSITFTFRVDAEPMFDAFLFKIDNVTQMKKFNSPTFETATFPVSSGIHTFSWVFFKDESFSSGLDQALIESIQILGAKGADSACSQCSPGSYSQGGAAKCSACEANTYSSQYGSTQCELCEADKFSYPGSIVCDLRQPCMSNDYFYSYTACSPEGRNKIYGFAEPVICDTSQFALPENELNILCAACNPGSYRAYESDLCEMCPVGSYSSILGATSCDGCPAGTSAVKELFYTQFDSFSDLKGVETWCDGQCSNDGWRFMSDDIDSGVGHGEKYDSTLQITIELIQPGKAYVNYSVFCNLYCKFLVVDNTDTIFPYYVYYGNSFSTFEIALDKGVHEIQIIFSEFYLNLNNDNRMVIHDFNITGVKHAGATHCASCPAGTYSTVGSESCTTCPPGTYSEEGAADYCSPCGPESFAPESGSTQCFPCGAGTVATDDSTDCYLNDCLFQLEDSEIFYNLSGIISSKEMYGPVWGEEAAFFLSPCQKEHGVHSCVDENEEPIPTFACMQANPRAIGVDIGSVQGYHALEEQVEGFDDARRAGLTMTFDNGENSCSNEYGETVPFRSSVMFLCEPSAGIGYPELITPAEGADPCTYKLLWKSYNACPRCNEEDYEEDFGSCVDGKYDIMKVRKTACNGPDILSKTTASCRFDSIYYLALIVLVVVLVVVVAAFAIRHKALSDRYETLVSSSNISHTEDWNGPELEEDEAVGDLRL